MKMKYTIALALTALGTAAFLVNAMVYFIFIILPFISVVVDRRVPVKFYFTFMRPDYNKEP